MGGTGRILADSCLVMNVTRSFKMAGWRQVVELAMTDEEVARLAAVSRSRTEPASRGERAQMVLAYRENPSFFAAGRRVGGHHQTVQRCVERALAYGPLVALDDRPRPGKEPTITPEAKAWLVSLACDKAKENGYPHARRASTGRRGDPGAWPGRFKAPSVRFSTGKKSSRTRCATTWSAGTPSLSRRWRRFSASIARSKSSSGRPPSRRKPASRWRSSP